jgi:hypothetical protein
MSEFVSDTRQQSVLRISHDGSVTWQHLQPEQDLAGIYRSALGCAYFTYARHHFFQPPGSETEYAIVLVADEEGQYNAAPMNDIVSIAAGFSFYGTALLVCMHVTEDGEEHLVDVRNVPWGSATGADNAELRLLLRLMNVDLDSEEEDRESYEDEDGEDSEEEDGEHGSEHGSE